LIEYTKRGKLALNVEYRNIVLDCVLSKRLQINSIKKDLYLAGGTSAAYKRQTCQ
jgi:hypothetical protein